MARPRSAGYEGQRDQILAAAARLFATRGYTAATMQDVAAACEVSKATLYHYVRDKQGLLRLITVSHVARLEGLVQAVQAERLHPQAHLQGLIERFMQAYACAEHEHRVLTEDVKFLDPANRDEVLAAQRRVVAAFAQAVAACRPELRPAGLHTPLAMLLFGMMNWTFTWLKPAGRLSHEQLAAVVVALFFGGLPAVQAAVPGA
ncbi:TetR family transcriptional regulator [beta proteobacterium AAP121]|nr:TetR family transcriptional regulator [beta proteobacterium AAP65]KPF97996.1 TetR family transcriptional regulator [beta proteobacterium AAP121]